MSTETRRYDVTVPANTPIATPYLAALPMPPRVPLSATVRVPSVALGSIGFALAMSGERVAPITRDTWIIGSNEQLSVSLVGAPDSGAWQVLAYNTTGADVVLHILMSVSPLARRMSSPIPEPLVLYANPSA